MREYGMIDGNLPDPAPSAAGRDVMPTQNYDLELQRIVGGVVDSILRAPETTSRSRSQGRRWSADPGAPESENAAQNHDHRVRAYVESRCRPT